MGYGKNKTKNTTGFKMFTRPTLKKIFFWAIGTRGEWDFRDERRVEFPCHGVYYTDK